MIPLQIDPHPLLELEWFDFELPAPLGELQAPWLADLLKLDAPAPFRPDEAVRGAVRDLLRHGGYKPTGRGKPASEYLVRAATEGALGSINAVVDACNAASLHSGIPISVVDLDLAKPPFRVGLGKPGEQYVFNASGQVIDVEGLLCLFDAEGPCANSVKDSQRTKTHAATRRILALMWGTKALPGRAKQTSDWNQELLRKAVG
jgi:DNA/RNA-binding domain of Phe-tRNA-synthetase-like protein